MARWDECGLFKLRRRSIRIDRDDTSQTTRPCAMLGSCRTEKNARHNRIGYVFSLVGCANRGHFAANPGPNAVLIPFSVKIAIAKDLVGRTKGSPQRLASLIAVRKRIASGLRSLLHCEVSHQGPFVRAHEGSKCYSGATRALSFCMIFCPGWWPLAAPITRRAIFLVCILSGNAKKKRKRENSIALSIHIAHLEAQTTTLTRS